MAVQAKPEVEERWMGKLRGHSVVEQPEALSNLALFVQERALFDTETDYGWEGDLSPQVSRTELNYILILRTSTCQ